MILLSRVPGHVGYCKPTWLNTNQIYNRLDGGITGTFKLVKRWWIFYFRIGQEFHGIIDDMIVKSTVIAEYDD